MTEIITMVNENDKDIDIAVRYLLKYVEKFNYENPCLDGTVKVEGKTYKLVFEQIEVE